MHKNKTDRKRVSLDGFLAHFATETDALRHIEPRRWKNGRICPWCESNQTHHASHKTMPYWCKPWCKYLRIKTATLMEGSNITERKWMMGIYLLSTSLQGVSSYKLANAIGMHQSSAWFMAHRIVLAMSEAQLLQGVSQNESQASEKYVDEFSTRHNVRELDAMVQIDSTICGLLGKRLKYADLIDGVNGTIH